ncbi:hypothetical protein D2V08_07265 [Flagellimonas lutimaris]|uniref:Uncharacterized protein n=1 Tax=Flagellimonas lutimaris TaxID=475082 RepID=A0A3A1NBZ2_9FLAO|nr:hypothetical protein [Allomuricauda lutimaris]RIV35156.1 hypothetical protein D2V08_07265 [Allomuricauda lutimaris]
MTQPKFYFFASLTIFIIVAILLITGSFVLTEPLYNGSTIPMGTPLTWLGIMSLPLAIYFGIERFRNPSKTYKFLSPLLKFSLATTILWVPVSYLLAGNLSFSFSEKEVFQGGQLAMKLFWGYSYGVVILPLLLLIIHWVLKLVNR